MTWKTAPFPFKAYEASTAGLIRRKKDHKMMNGGLKGKYRGVNLQSNFGEEYWYVHRFIMLVFIGPSSLHVNHKNGIKEDNCLANLEYVTRLVNNRHSINTGLSKNTLDWEEVEHIRAMHSNGMDVELLAEMYDLLQPAIWKVVNFYTWKLKGPKVCAPKHYDHSDDYAVRYLDGNISL